MVIIEAMACGNVVIATDHVGPMEIIEDGHDGYLATEHEYKNRTTEILSYLFDNRDHLQEMKRYAKIKSEKYTASNISRAWDKLLAKHLKGS